MMVRTTLNAVLLLLVMTFLLGIVYPSLVTAVAQVFYPYQANGSLVANNGQVVGSALIGQDFTDVRYFHGRPSAAGNKGYDATASAGSNLGPTNHNLLDLIRTRLAAFRQENTLSLDAPVPADIVTSSASGLDPDISPEAAYLQCARVAKARNLPEATVRSLVAQHIPQRQLRLLGDITVNVLQLNLDLDRLGK